MIVSKSRYLQLLEKEKRGECKLHVYCIDKSTGQVDVISVPTKSIYSSKVLTPEQDPIKIPDDYVFSEQKRGKNVNGRPTTIIIDDLYATSASLNLRKHLDI